MSAQPQQSKHQSVIDPALLVSGKLEELPEGTFDPYRDYFLANQSRGLLAILLYGSCLSDTTRSSDSMPDFYLVIESGRVFFDRWRDRMLDTFLPPNIFYKEIEVSGEKRPFKYCVITLEALERETSPYAGDFYHLGRFSKRMGLLWCLNEGVKAALADCMVSAMRVLIPHALAKLGNAFLLEDFSRTLLALSYMGELRIEGGEKVDAIYAAEKDYYHRVHSLLLDQFVRANRALFKVPEKGAAGFAMRRTVSEKNKALAGTDAFIRRSRRLAKARWPKQMLTVDNWLELILAKYERTHGEKIELTPLQRKYPLIFAWGQFFKAIKRGKVH